MKTDCRAKVCNRCDYGPRIVKLPDVDLWMVSCFRCGDQIEVGNKDLVAAIESWNTQMRANVQLEFDFG